MTRLIEHFGERKGDTDPPIDKEIAQQEWPVFKNYMFNAMHEIRVSTEPMTMATLTEKLVTSRDAYTHFPNMIKLLSISRILPASSVECERGFSTQNLIKTRLRCNLNIETLDQTMRVSLNGPSIQLFDPVPVFCKWRERKERRVFSNTDSLNKLY